MVVAKRYSLLVIASLACAGLMTFFAVINWQVNYQSFGNGITTATLSCPPHSTKTKMKTDWTTKINVNILTPKQIIDYFYWTNSESCILSHDFGGKMLQNPSGFDGQKSICLDPLVRPESGNCIVYSFGINNDWSFDEALEKYGCQVFAFDPSMGKQDHDHSEKVHFYNMGLGEKDYTSDKGWKIRALDSIYKKLTKEAHLSQEKVIDYLKIDIELAEWKVIPQIIQSGMLKKVRQLGIEFHLGTGN